MLSQNIRRGQNAVRRGFTLMEVIVVAAIIVILAGAGTVVYMKFIEDAKVDQARMECQQIETAVLAYSRTIIARSVEGGIPD
jgi:prepilin-type N-terminal cleavage/methylation domain-containing protein